MVGFQEIKSHLLKLRRLFNWIIYV